MKDNDIKVSRRGFLSGLGKVVAGVWAAGLAGCTGNDVVDYVIANRVINSREKDEEKIGENKKGLCAAPYDVKLAAYYRIKDTKTGNVEIIEGNYGQLTEDWRNNYHKNYRNKYPNGFTVDFVEDGRILAMFRPSEKNSD